MSASRRTWPGRIMPRVALPLLAGLLATACGGGTADSDDTAADIAEPEEETLAHDEIEDEFGAVPEPSESYSLGVVLKTLANEHWQEMQQGYEDAAAEYGIDVEVQAAESEDDLTGQLAIAESMLSQDFDAFAVSPLSESNLDSFLESASDQGIPVLNVDDARVDARVFIGSDHEQIGEIAANDLVSQLNEGDKVAQIQGQPGSHAARQRTAGFDRVMEQHTEYDYVDSQAADWDRQQAFDVTTNILQKHPDLKGLYANNDTMALGAMEAVLEEGLGDQVLVIGTDGTPEAQRSIRDGEMYGTVATFPYDMGYTAVEMAIRLLEGQGVPEWVVSRQELVTEANIDDAFPE